MKKIFALVFLLVLGKFSYSQGYPLQQNLGSDSTIVISKGALQSRLIPIVITDTNAANAQRLKNYPGAQLYTSNGNFYIRNANATKWLLVSSGSVGAVNIYNSNGTLTGSRTLQGDGKDLLFDNVGDFSVVGNGVTLTQNGASAAFSIKGDTSSFINRASYENNYASDFTKHSLVDKNYVDSSIGSIPSGGTVTSVATNNGTGITGGTITTTGTLAIDTTLISTRAYANNGLAGKLNISDTATMLAPYFRTAGVGLVGSGHTVYADTLLLSTRAWRQKGIDSVASLINTNINGTINYIPKFTGTHTLGNSSISEGSYSVDINNANLTIPIGYLFKVGGSSSSAYLGDFNTVGNLDFATSNTLRMRISNNGNIGVGLNSPDSMLTVYGGTYLQRGLRLSGIPQSTGTKILKYDPSTGVVSYSDSTAVSGGTVTSVNSGYGLSGGPITTTGTLSVDSASLSNYYLRRKDSLTNTNPLGYVTNTVLADTASAIRASIPTPTGGTVTSVATNNGTGITGGTITSTGTLAIDTTLISTRAWRQKGIDSVAALPKVTSVATNTATGITGGTITSTGTLAIDTTLISTRAWRQKGIDSVASLPRVTSVGLSMPSAFNVANSPITSSGTLAVTGAGTNAQYIRGDGTLGSLPSISGQTGWYGSFSDTLNQFAANTTTSYPIYIRITDDANGVTNDGGNAIIVNNTGVYNIQYSIQFVNTDNTIHDADVFLVYNGNVLTNSNSQYSIPNKHGSVDGHLIAAINYVLPLNAGDSINLKWATTNTAVSIQTLPAQTTPDVPRSPGIILTVTSQAAQGIGYEGLVSGSAITLGTGSKTFTTNLNNSQTAFAVGTRVRVADSTNTANYFEGPITSFSGTTMVVNSDLYNGSGSHSTWKISVAGAQGSGGIQSLNGLTALTQTFATGTSGTDFNISSVSSTHTFNLPTASATNRGALSSADWTTFNNKGNGSVTSVATNTATGITGGTITTTGTLAIDTSLISTRAWRQKGIDSVQANLTAGLATKLNISDTATMLSPYKTYYPRNAISLTTTGSSGASTYNPSTGVLNVPVYTDAYTGTVTSVATNNGTGITGGTITTTGTLAIDTSLISTRAWRQKGVDSVAALITGGGYVTGSGTTNYLPKFTGSSSIGNSLVYDNGTNVGIGTSSPAYKLDVSGTGRFTSNVGIGTAPSQLLTLGGSSDVQMSLISSTTTGSDEIYFGDSDGTYRGLLRYANNGDYMSFHTAASERMRLDASGNLGLGVTPSAWVSSTSAFQLKEGWASLSSDTYFGSLDLTNNAYQSTTSTWNYKNTLSASRYQQLNGEHRFYNAPSGTAGNAISFTQAMTLDASGRLGIGTTTPAQKLTIGSGHILLSDNYGLLWDNSGNNAIYGNGTSNYLKFYANNSEQMRLTSTGLGIGTTSPYTKLELVGPATNWSNSASIVFTDNVYTTNSRRWLVGNVATDYGSFNIASSTTSTGDPTTSRLTITKDGNVGIGTTSPGGKLHISTNASGAYLEQIIENTNSGGYVRTLYKIGSAGASGIAGFNYAPSLFFKIGVQENDSSTPLTFVVNSGTEAMRITSGGNVLVGTTTDAGYKLDVNGTGRFAGRISTTGGSANDVFSQYVTIQDITSTNDYVLRFRNNAGSSIGYIGVISSSGVFQYNNSNGHNFTGAATFSSSVTATNGWYKLTGTSIPSLSPTSWSGTFNITRSDGAVGTAIGYNGATGDTWIQAQGNNTYYNLLLQPNGGNVGIGTTSPSGRLQVASASAGDDQIWLQSTSYTGGYSKLGYNASTGEFRLTQNDGGVGMTFYTGSGTPSEKVRITTGGNVLVGTTSDSGAKLRVNGTIQTDGIENAGKWRLGGAYDASGLTLVTTKYLTVEIDGVSYKVALAQ